MSTGSILKRAIVPAVIVALLVAAAVRDVPRRRAPRR